MRQLVGACVEFLIGQLLISEDDRNRLWGALYLLLEQLVDALVPWGGFALFGVVGDGIPHSSASGGALIPLDQEF